MGTFLVNPRRAAAHGWPVRRDARAFHRRLPGYEATPLVDAPRLAERLGVGRVWVKDESSRLGLPSFKMLGASWATYCALQQRLDDDLTAWASVEELSDLVAPLRPFRLCAATDGNHGRAVARMARLLGFGATIFVPGGTASARIEAIQGEGATVVVVDGTYDDAVARSAEEDGPRCQVVSDTSWPGYTDVPSWVIEGYSTIAEEVDEQVDSASRSKGRSGPVDVVAVPVGVGALAAAMAAHYRRQPGRQPWLLGVEPDSAACVMAAVEAGQPTLVPGPHRSIMAGLNCGLASVVALPEVAAGFDAFVAVDDERTREAMRWLHEVGVVAGETGAAALAGLAEVVAQGRSPLGPTSTVLILNTEGATDPVAWAEVVGTAVPA